MVDPALRQVIDLLEVGFPSSAEAFHARYELIAAEQRADIWDFLLLPRSEAARRLLDGIRLEVAGSGWQLIATEFEFPDGSRMRNSFSGLRVNEPVDESLFELTPGQDWLVSEPLAN